MTTTATETTSKTNYLTITTSAFSEAKNAGNNAVTVSFWINPYYALDLSQNNRQYGNIFVAYGNGTGVNVDMAIGLNARANLGTHCNLNYSPYNYYYDESTGNNYAWLSKGASFANSWHHVALVYSLDGSSNVIIKQYVDGELLNSYTKANAGSGAQATYNEMTLLDQFTKFVIGGNDQIFSDPDNAYAYDDIAIYSTALSADQIAKIHSAKTDENIIGSVYYTTGFLGEMKTYTLSKGEEINLKFQNHGKNTQNYYNWIARLHSSELGYLTLRADNYIIEATPRGNSTYSMTMNGGSVNWTYYRAEMFNAPVDMFISYSSTGHISIYVIDGVTRTYVHQCFYKNVLSEDLTFDIGGEYTWLEMKSIGSTGWTTFASPYALDLSNMLSSGDDVTAYYASAVGDNSVTLTSIDKSDVAAGEGIMLKGTAGDQVAIPVVASGTTISGNKLVGCTTETPLSASANYYVLVNNGGTAEFQSLEDNGATIPAGKAYLNVDKKAKALRVVIDGETTEVVAPEVAETEEDEVLYNMAGIRVGKNFKGFVVNQKGVKRFNR